MLRLSQSHTPGRPRFMLEGKLAGPWVDELAAAMEREFERGSRPTLDLQRVGFVDHAGLSLLRRLQARGVAIEGRSGFVAELMRAEDQP